jgi:hypothetical protein
MILVMRALASAGISRDACVTNETLYPQRATPGRPEGPWEK